MIDYISEFPLSESLMPQKLKEMLAPISADDPEEMVEITNSFEVRDDSGEAYHMIMAGVPSTQISTLFNIYEGCTVAFSTPACEKGEWRGNFNISGFDYLVSSWGDGGRFSYCLNDKVWMTLGLSPRCIAGNQSLIWDDLSKPLTKVAYGGLHYEYEGVQKNNISWKMRNDYLREYLWYRDHAAVRVFYYKNYIKNCNEIQKFLGSNEYIKFGGEGDWYELIIQKDNDKLLMQIWATVVAVLPDKCDEADINSLVWPGFEKAISKREVNNIIDPISRRPIYLKDTFLQKYECNDAYSVTPTSGSVSYKNQWSICGPFRSGRNYIRISIRDMYKGVPDKEIIHAHRYAIDPKLLGETDIAEMNIASRTERLYKTLVVTGKALVLLAQKLNLPQKSVEDYIGIDPQHIEYYGLWENTFFSKLARVAPEDMTEDLFLQRCKTLHECINQFKSGPLKQFLREAGIPKEELSGLQSLRLLQGIMNVAEYLCENSEDYSEWSTATQNCDWKTENINMKALFINNYIRQIESHEKHGELTDVLGRLGIESSLTQDGYGLVLDKVYSEVTRSLNQLFTIINRICS